MTTSSRRRAAPSQLSHRARAIIARTRAARAAIDCALAGVEVEDGPGVELGPPRDTGVAHWLDRDINPRGRAKKRARR